jgi:hypothetical protein
MRERPASRVLSLFFFIVFSAGHAFGQQPHDSTLTNPATRNAYRVYSNTIGNEANLYNGVEYAGYNEHNNDVGNAYFLSNDWSDGSVEYDGGQYDNVSLMYDLVTDQLILEQPYSHFKLALISGKVKNFTLGGHTFVYLAGSKNDSLIRPGFYDRLYGGRTSVFARRSKHLVQRIELREVVIEYPPTTRYFILKDGVFFPVKSRASVLAVFRDRKKELRKLIRKNRLNFSDDREHAIAEVAGYYDAPPAPH